MADDMLKFFFVMVSLAAAGGVAYTLIALGHTLAQRLGLREKSSEFGADLAEVQARLTELDELQARLTEVEERLDFAERQLAQSENARLKS
jgi:Tfp pilus assembly protein PilO